MKRFLKFAIITLIILHLVLLYYGVASIVTCILFYTTLMYISVKALNRYIHNNKKRSNIILLFITFFSFLMLGEFSLKYIFKMNLSYAEANGNFFYFSPYKQIKLENLKRKYILKQDNLHLKINKPDSRQNFETPEFSYYHTYNHLGLRSSDSAIPRQTYCIIGLGDSFTEGVGVPDDSTWCELLEDELNNNQCFENPVRVINAGVYGSDPFYDYKRIEYLLKFMKPDLLLLSINTSDIVDVMTRGGFERFKKNGDIVYNSPPWWEVIYSYSFISRSIAHGIFKIGNTLMTPEQEKTQTETAENLITQLVSDYYKPLSVHYGFEILVVFQPMKFDLEQNNNQLQKLHNKISQKGIKVLDLHTPFSEYIIQTEGKTSAFFWPNDRHLNSSGTLMTAKFIADEILLHLHPLKIKKIDEENSIPFTCYFNN